MKWLSFRKINLTAFLLCFFLLIASYYFEYIKEMTPCLLCLLQRWAVGILALIFGLSILHEPKNWGKVVYSFMSLFFTFAGLAASARQTWLQHQPLGTNTSCIPSFHFLIKTRPFHEVLQIMFQGGQDCAMVLWQLFGFTMAQWVFGFFLFILLLVIFSITALFISQSE